MKENAVRSIWGLVLILAGGLFLAQSFGYIEALSAEFWMIFLAGLSLLFFISYFVTGLRNWGWLFPATILGSVAATIFLTELGYEDAVVAAPILLGTAVPFVVAYALAPGRNWWALIPAWVLSVVTAITLLAERVPGEWIGTLFLLAIALPFLLVFLLDRTRRWALIPSFVLIAVAMIPPLTLVTTGELVGTFVMLMIALPFIAVYFLSPKNWWALIPAGAMTTMALLPLLALNQRSDDLIGGVLVLGLALTFGLLWLMRRTHPTDWAKFPAAILGIMALVAFGLGSEQVNYLWPVAIILAGVLVLFNALRPRRPGGV